MQDNAMRQPRRIDHLSDVSGDYDVIFCDIWGVVHNGLAKHPHAEAALTAARAGGARVVLLTNAPRRSLGIVAQLDHFGFSRDAYDAVVTSGDATRALIEEAGGPAFHIGPERDYDLFADLGVERVEDPDRAAIAVVTGLYDDETETPEDYAELLSRFRATGLPMICANPDIVVHRGEQLVYCAGAIAQEYAKLGGEVAMAGKPHAAIYREARRVAEVADDAAILAIGDGLFTDIKGANQAGVDVLLITGGIHGQDFGDEPENPAAIARVLAENGLAADYFMAALR
ncbi:TIGR01459 family HAD-type hydrolase [Jiella marina]|uniref:TIGR01459 family HAD-type hydrolase n=1 Tax=Jiella sp. LLJ827 TaxID=2917712 RepID=UPI002101B3FE|nr:TIGR01459 family HAD-type hydrolase [Jiella sp. LLJ827]MCQ0988456.1 TIGR01459 family HAD-type hydrolase [Jiella sp. LLJ827]